MLDLYLNITMLFIFRIMCIIDALEGVQRRFTKLLPGFYNVEYVDKFTKFTYGINFRYFIKLTYFIKFTNFVCSDWIFM